MDNLQQPSRNDDNGRSMQQVGSISDQNNIFVSVGGTLYNTNDNGNIRYLQTPNSISDGRDTKMRVYYEEEVAASSPNGEREKGQRVKSRETQQTA